MAARSSEPGLTWEQRPPGLKVEAQRDQMIISSREGEMGKSCKGDMPFDCFWEVVFIFLVDCLGLTLVR